MTVRESQINEAEVVNRGFILIAEDNRVNQKIAAMLVGKLGYSSEVVFNGLEVLEAMSQKRYDLVLMDCQMPEMDGLEATIEIRQRESGTQRHIPIIALTANAMAGEREKCLSTGMDDYLTKPFKQEELSRILEQWVERQTVEVSQDDSQEEPSQVSYV
jgi:CheY-like chemotaxis protein